MSEVAPVTPHHPGFAEEADLAWHALLRIWLVAELPYILLIIASLIGVAWTSLSGEPASHYWVGMAPLSAAVCIAVGWRHCQGRDRHVALIVTQILQWSAVLVAMWLLLLSDVRGLLNDDSIGLMFLTLIALAIFISGLYGRTWRLCAVGMFLGGAVPMLAWVERAALILIAIAIGLIALSFTYWWGRRAYLRRRSIPA